MGKAGKTSKGGRPGLSERTKKVILISTGSVLIVVGGWWAYMTFTTVPPPALETATPDQVVSFLGNTRGLGRMPIEQRGQYLADMYTRFSEGPARQDLNRAFAQMSTREKQEFVDATLDVFQYHFLEQAAEYNRLPGNQKRQFVDQMIQGFESRRRGMAGVGGSDNMGEAFKGMMPTSTDGMMKMMVERTNTRQRAKAQPLVDELAVRYKDMQDRKALQ